jgi:hypothetical protein
MSEIIDTAATDAMDAPAKQTHPVTGEPSRARYDLELVHELAKIGCSLAEIARLVNCKDDDLRGEPYREIIEHGRANLNRDLRKKQIEVAKAGDPSMLKWLGQIYLKQSAIDRQIVRMDFSRMTDAELEEWIKATNGEDYKQQTLFD